MTTKVEIDTKLFETISEIAKGENISENEVIEIAIKDFKKELLFKKIEERGGKIANKDTYDPTSKGFESLCGTIDVPEGFDVVKAVNDSRIGKYD